MVKQRQCWLSAVGGFVLLGLTCSVVMGHNGEIPGVPGSPTSVPSVSADRIYPVRWSWLHWWESNRDPFFQIIRQSHPQRIAPEILAKYRSDALEALLAALKSDMPPLRASAVVALGQIGDPKALAPLSELAAKDPMEAVSLLSIVSLGLLDTPEAEKAILALTWTDAAHREAALCALGLMSNSSPDVVASLQKTVVDPDPAQAAIAAWALGRKVDPASIRFLQDVLSKPQTLSVWLSSEALLSMGRQKQADSADALAQVLLGSPQGRSIPAWKELDSRRSQIMAAFARGKADMAAYQAGYADYVKRLKDWHTKYTPNAPPAGPQPGGAAPGNAGAIQMQMGLEEIYMARLQASAAIALGNIDTLVSRQALLKCLEARDDGYCQIYKEFAVMSLAKLGEPAAVPVLIELLSPVNATGGRKSSDKLKSPLRGFAAIALGIYSRPDQTRQGPVDRPDFDKACLKLAERMVDTAEETEVRTASTVALGLTGRTENLRYLQPAGRTVTDKDDLLAGYMLMARGMLGDKNILEAAKKYLAPANEKQDASGILGRRAAIMGLALMDSQEAIPVLMEARSLGYHSNRELCIALAMCGAYNVTDRLIKVMKEDPFPWERAFAARCLGEIFNRQRPQRLAWLIGDNNYTLRNSRLMRYQAVANEFLYLYLLPAFGSEWR
jgi:HEAT repeat protein